MLLSRPTFTPDASAAAEAMFNAYNEHGPTPWVTFDGRPVPRWNELNDAVRGKWIAAAAKAQQLFGAR